MSSVRLAKACPLELLTRFGFAGVRQFELGRAPLECLVCVDDVRWLVNGAKVGGPRRPAAASDGGQLVEAHFYAVALLVLGEFWLGASCVSLAVLR